jgi:hypothetical protein
VLVLFLPHKFTDPQHCYLHNKADNYQAGKNSSNIMLALSSTQMCPLAPIICVSDGDPDNTH